MCTKAKISLQSCLNWWPRVFPSCSPQSSWSQPFQLQVSSDLLQRSKHRKEKYRACKPTKFQTNGSSHVSKWGRKLPRKCTKIWRPIEQECISWKWSLFWQGSLKASKVRQIDRTCRQSWQRRRWLDRKCADICGKEARGVQDEVWLKDRLYQMICRVRDD